jgi:hypothetical protein
MKISNSPTLSPELDEVIHPKSYLMKKTGRYMIAGILVLSQQYSDPDILKEAQIQSTKRWHAINEIYEPAFGECNLTVSQLQ